LKDIYRTNFQDARFNNHTNGSMSSLEIKKRFHCGKSFLGGMDKGYSQDRNAGAEMMHFAGEDKDRSANNRSMVM
jgi:hypothetical protein